MKGSLAFMGQETCSLKVGFLLLEYLINIKLNKNVKGPEILFP
jgi:hypothetical protein